MKHILFFIFCLIPLIGFSQDCKFSLSGTVVDFHDGTVIEKANVFVKNTNKFAVTDKKGTFLLSGLCKGKITLVISHVACKTIEKEITISKNHQERFLIEHHTEELEEVTVKGKSITKKTSSLSETVLSKKVIESFSASSLGDALKEVAGISSINTGNAIVKPMINGMHSSRIIVMNNGVRLQDQEWGIEHAPNVDINSSESISVIKGAGALAYGSDAIGGVVVLNGKNPIRVDSIFGNTIAGYQNNGRVYNLATSLSKTYQSGYYINANASYKRFGDFKAPNYFLTNTGSESYAFSIDAGFKTFEKGWSVFVSKISHEIGILRASHIGGIQDLVNAINNQEPLIQEDFSYQIGFPKQDVEHWIAKVNFFKRFKSLGKLTLQYDFQENQRFEFDRRVGDDRFKPAVDLNLKTHSFTTDFLFDSTPSWKIQSGALFRFQENIANPDTGIRRLIPDYNRTDFGLYTTAIYTISDTWKLDLGARYDFSFYGVKKFYQTSRWFALGYDVLFPEIVIQDLGNQLLTNPKLTFHNVAVSLGANNTINEKDMVLFNYTFAQRPPNISELFSDGLHHSAARIELGDLTLNSEVSHRFSTSYQRKDEQTNWQIDGYINWIPNYIFLAPNGTEQTIRGAFPVWNYQQTNAFLAGFDINYSKRFSENFSYNMNASYIYAQDLEANQPIIDMPPIQIRNTISYQHKNWNNFSSSVTSEFVGRQNRFPNFNFSQYIAETDSTVLVDISTPPSAFHLLHFKNSIDVNWIKNAKTQLSFNINNLLNTSYRDYLNRLRFFADDLGRNIQIQLIINY